MLNLDDPTVRFNFRVNLMLGELTYIIREQLNPAQVDWKAADRHVLFELQQLDTCIGRLNSITEKQLNDSKTQT